MLMNFADVHFWEALVTATALTLIAYFVGDQLILRRANNAVATVSDILLSYVVLWVAADAMRWDLTVGEILMIAVVLGIAEWFLHRFVFQHRVKGA